MRLLLVICLLIGCSKPKLPVAQIPDGGCREADMRNCAVTFKNTESAVIESGTTMLSASIADLKKHIEHNAEADRLIADCIRQTEEEWIARHCESRQKAWLRKQAQYEAEDKKP